MVAKELLIVRFITWLRISLNDVIYLVRTFSIFNLANPYFKYILLYLLI